MEAPVVRRGIAENGRAAVSPEVAIGARPRSSFERLGELLEQAAGICRKLAAESEIRVAAGHEQSDITDVKPAPLMNVSALAERLSRALPGAIHPAGIILYAGSADLRFEPALAVTEIRRRVAAVVDELRRRAPAAPIALLEVLPGRTAFHGEHAGLDALNRELASLASERGLAFVRTRRPPLVDGNGVDSGEA